MTGCLNCGRDCDGARCKHCSVEHSAPDHDTGECPQCGGPSLSDGVACADCRRDKARTDGSEPAGEEHGTTEQNDEEQQNSALLLRLPRFPVVGNAPWYLVILAIMAFVTWEIAQQLIEVMA